MRSDRTVSPNTKWNSWNIQSSVSCHSRSPTDTPSSSLSMYASAGETKLTLIHWLWHTDNDTGTYWNIRCWLTWKLFPEEVWPVGWFTNEIFLGVLCGDHRPRLLAGGRTVGPHACRGTVKAMVVLWRRRWRRRRRMRRTRRRSTVLKQIFQLMLVLCHLRCYKSLK